MSISTFLTLTRSLSFFFFFIMFSFPTFYLLFLFLIFVFTYIYSCYYISFRSSVHSFVYLFICLLFIHTPPVSFPHYFLYFLPFYSSHAVQPTAFYCPIFLPYLSILIHYHPLSGSSKVTICDHVLSLPVTVPLKKHTSTLFSSFV